MNLPVHAPILQFAGTCPECGKDCAWLGSLHGPMTLNLPLCEDCGGKPDTSRAYRVLNIMENGPVGIVYFGFSEDEAKAAASDADDLSGRGVTLETLKLLTDTPRYVLVVDSVDEVRPRTNWPELSVRDLAVDCRTATDSRAPTEAAMDLPTVTDLGQARDLLARFVAEHGDETCVAYIYEAASWDLGHYEWPLRALEWSRQGGYNLYTP